MATLVSQRETEPGVWRRAWIEDGFLYHDYLDTRQHRRMDYRKAMRSVNPKIRRDQEALYGVGYLAEVEREQLKKRFPRLGDPDPHISQQAWKEFWQSSHSEPYRVVDRV